MITENMYLLAQEVIKEYEKGMELHNNRQIKITDGLKKGDYVTYIGGNRSKYLTPGKNYRLGVVPWLTYNKVIRVRVKMDNGKSFNFYSRYFRHIIKD